MARDDALYWVDVHLSGVGKDVLGAGASVERAEDVGLAERLLTNPFSATIPLLAARLINNGAKGAPAITLSLLSALNGAGTAGLSGEGAVREFSANTASYPFGATAVFEPADVPGSIRRFGNQSGDFGAALGM